jgi:hypothetical protein
MTYATLMVHLELGRPNANLLKFVGDLAAKFHAGVIGITACQPMQLVYGDGYVPVTSSSRIRRKSKRRSGTPKRSSAPRSMLMQELCNGART